MASRLTGLGGHTGSTSERCDDFQTSPILQRDVEADPLLAEPSSASLRDTSTICHGLTPKSIAEAIRPLEPSQEDSQLAISSEINGDHSETCVEPFQLSQISSDREQRPSPSPIGSSHTTDLIAIPSSVSRVSLPGSSLLDSDGVDRHHDAIRVVQHEHATKMEHASVQASFDEIAPSLEPDVITEAALHRQIQKDASANPEPPWTPIWMRPVTLWGFVTLFACMAIALIVLWQVAIARNGISVAAVKNDRYWKFGPTALLVVVIELWNQVDKHCRLLVPWSSVLQQPKFEVTEDHLLLEYFSPMPHTIILQAFARRHIPVLATVFGGMLLKLIVAASTGLLVLTPTSMTNPYYSIGITNKFDPAPFLNSGPDYYRMDSNAMLYYGNLELGLPLENGTGRSTAFQQFVVPSIKDNDVVTLSAETFYSDYACVIPNIVILKPLSDKGLFTFEMDVPPCPAALESSPDNSSLATTILSVRTMSNITLGLPRHTHVDYYPFPCADYLGVRRDPLMDVFDHTNLSTDFFLNYEVSWSPTMTPKPSGSNFTGNLDRLTVVACNMNFRARRSTVTFASTRSFEIVDEGTEISSGELNSSHLQQIMKSRVFDTLSIPGTAIPEPSQFDFSGQTYFDTKQKPQSPPYRKRPSAWHATFQLFARSAGRKSWLETFDSKVLKEGAETTMNGIMAHWAASNLFTTVNEIQTASLSHTEDRLQVTPRSLWLMFVGLLIMACFGVLMAITRPVSTTHVSPASITGFMAVLAQNTALRQKLTEFARTEKVATIKNAPAWYHPFTSSLGYVAAIVVVSLGVIGTLEGLQQKSDSEDGFVHFDSTSRAAQACTQYVPAIFMVVFSICYASFDFNVSMFSQFSKLKNGATSGETVDKDLIIPMKVYAVWTAARARQFGATFSILATLCASVLTIATSGLYSIATHPTTFVVPFREHGVVDAMLSNGSIGDSGAAMTLSLMDNFNISFPKGTHENLVIPQLASTSSSINLTDTSLSIQLPLYRSVLDCQPLPTENIAAWLRLASERGKDAEIDLIATPNLPENCQLSEPPIANHRIPRFVSGVGHYDDVDESQILYHGGALNLEFYPEAILDEPPPWSLNQLKEAPGNLTGCPTLALFIAAFNWSDIADAIPGFSASRGSNFTNSTLSHHRLPVDGINMLQCSQKIQIVPAEVHMLLPDFALDLSRPPVVIHKDTTPTQYLTNGTDGIDTFAFDFLHNLADFYKLLAVPNVTGTGSSPTRDFHPFILSLLYGPEAVPLADITGPSPASRDRLYRSADRLYGRYMAQFLNANSRRAVTDGGEWTIRNGTVESRNEYRVLQNRGPKVALQVLLGVMGVSAILTYVLVDLRSTLLREPFSIAGKAALIAGGGMLQIVRASEGVAGGNMGGVAKSPLEGLRLRLGWWEDGREGVESGVGEEEMRVDGGRVSSEGENWEGRNSGSEDVVERGEFIGQTTGRGTTLWYGIDVVLDS